jgi:hypothetical protein
VRNNSTKKYNSIDIDGAASRDAASYYIMVLFVHKRCNNAARWHQVDISSAILQQDGTICLQAIPSCNNLAFCPPTEPSLDSKALNRATEYFIT